jgi:hypothetical protein
MSIAVVTLFWVSMGWTQPGRSQELILLTSEEAMQLRLTTEDLDRETGSAPRTRTISLGPRIVIQKPQITGTATHPTLETDSPADIIVAFEALHAPVNMDSLQVTAKKGWFTKSLTDRLTPFVEGTQLAATGVKIPRGQFLIQIAIADQQGTERVETYRLTVR